MIFDRIMLPAQGRNEDYKFAQTGRVTLVASAGGGGSSTPAPSWLENVIKIDPESGFLSVDDWHVKGNLVIEGQVNQWLAQQLVVDDARIQVNRKQDGAVADSGLVIYDKDTSAEVSSLVYDVNGVWKAGGDRLFTEAYNPKLGGLPAADYATKNWVENSATAYNAARLGGYSAASYPRKAEAATITGKWTFDDFLTQNSSNGDLMKIHNRSWAVNHFTGIEFWNGAKANKPLATSKIIIQMPGAGDRGDNIIFQNQRRQGVNPNTTEPETILTLNDEGNAIFSGNLLVSGTSTLTGNVTAEGQLSVAQAATLQSTLSVAQAATFGGNAGTSDFVSQMQGWRVTPQGQADFRHIFTDELQAKAFTADISQALVGSDILTKSVAKLAQNWETTANGATSTIYVEELEGFPGFQVFAVGDRLLLRLFDRAGGGLLIKNIWATVASYVSTTKNVQRYTITVNSGGAAGHTVYAGSMILDYGTSGSGVIERTVLDQQGSPYSRVSTWTGSPDNPANYTLHYQSGNLNGISNAEGWGVYSENSFLTGKLLVGDLTKAGQFMEYENGQLKVKGQITVTGGNAATKADVDAVQVGGRNLWKNSRTVPEKVVVGQYGYVEFGPQVSAFSIKTGDTVTFGIGVTDIPAGEAVRVRVDFYRADNTYLQGDLGSAVSESGRSAVTFVVPDLSEFTSVRYRVYPVGWAANYSVKIYNEKLELGNRATDWTPAPEDVDAGITAAESAAKGYADGAAAAAESAAKTFATSEANAALAAAEGYTDTLKDRVENTLGLADLENINETLITNGKVRTALLEATEIKSLLITAENIEGLTLNFDKGKIGAWIIGSTFLESETGKMRIGGGSVPVIQMRPDWGVPGNELLINATNPSNWGIRGRVGGTNVFQLGSTNQIDGFEFGGKALAHAQGGSFVAMNNHPTAAATAGGVDSKIYRGFGIYHNDTEIDGAANAFRAIRIGHLATPADDIPDGQSGIQITRRINNVDKDIFRVDGDKAFIASINFSDSEMWGSFPGVTPSFNNSPARIRLSSLGQSDLEQPFVEVGLRTGTWSHMGRFGIAAVELNGTGTQRPLTQLTHNGVRCNYYPQSTSTSTTTYTEMQNNRIRVVAAGSSRFEAYYNNNVLQLFARNLPSSSSGLASGQIWRDATGNLKIV